MLRHVKSTWRVQCYRMNSSHSQLIKCVEDILWMRSRFICVERRRPIESVGDEWRGWPGNEWQTCEPGDRYLLVFHWLYYCCSLFPSFPLYPVHFFFKLISLIRARKCFRNQLCHDIVKRPPSIVSADCVCIWFWEKENLSDLSGHSNWV